MTRRMLIIIFLSTLVSPCPELGRCILSCAMPCPCAKQNKADGPVEAANNEPNELEV
jgi:hypothetical protein